MATFWFSPRVPSSFKKDKKSFSLALLFLPLLSFPVTELYGAERRGKRVIRIQEATRIIGEIQRPQVTYILNRSRRVQMSLDPSLERIRPSFLREYERVIHQRPDVFLPSSEP